MRNKDITTYVLVQDSDVSAQVPWYRSNFCNKSLLENRSSRSGYAKIMLALFIDRREGPVGPGWINIRNKDTTLNVLLQDNDMSAQVPWFKAMFATKVCWKIGPLGPVTQR